VAVIPGQAAALFEALLSYDKQRNANAQELEKKNGNQLQPPSEGVGGPQSSSSRLIDAVTPCSTCGATMHWVDATYCWSCGNTL
jgi:hypothetical protein